MSLIKYATKRLIAKIPVFFGILTLTFIISRLLPGDPVIAILRAKYEFNPSPERITSFRHELGLDQPIIIQYFRYLADLFTGNWGESISVNRGIEVRYLIAQRLPRTIDLTLFSIIIASYIGIKVGVISAVHRNKVRDTVFRGIALIGVSVPIFFLGMLMQFYLGYQVELFPTAGYKQVEYPDPPYLTGFILIDSIFDGQFFLFIDYLWHISMPVFCLSFVSIAGIVRQTRSSMLEVLEQDYVRTARAKGCKEKDVVHTHALKNALIPTATVIGLNFVGLLSGVVLVETTFGIWGIGSTLVDAIEKVDYWVLNAVLFVITIIYVLTTLITDLIYGVLDPRIRY